LTIGRTTECSTFRLDSERIYYEDKKTWRIYYNNLRPSLAEFSLQCMCYHNEKDIVVPKNYWQLNNECSKEVFIGR
jgi:hypothetical protein